MKTGIFYGSTTGTTAELARDIAKEMGIADADVHDVASTAPARLGDYDFIILGSSTWGDGDLQEDWYDFIDGAQALDLDGKKIAIFGCGDQTMSDTFCNAVGIIYDKLKDSGAVFVGEYDADGYNFEHSDASHGKLMRGLVVDQVNHPEWTARRVKAWTDILKKS